MADENVEQVEEAAAPVEAQADPLEAVTRERDEYLDTLQRLKAEFDNYRKRVAGGEKGGGGGGGEKRGRDGTVSSSRA